MQSDFQVQVQVAYETSTCTWIDNKNGGKITIIKKKIIKKESKNIFHK